MSLSASLPLYTVSYSIPCDAKYLSSSAPLSASTLSSMTTTQRPSGLYMSYSNRFVELKMSRVTLMRVGVMLVLMIASIVEASFDANVKASHCL